MPNPISACISGATMSAFWISGSTSTVGKGLLGAI